MLPQAGQLAELGVAWVAQMLLCVFEMMYTGGQATAGGSAAAGSSAGVTATTRLQLLRELKALPVIPVVDMQRQRQQAGQEDSGAAGVSQRFVSLAECGAGRPLLLPLQLGQLQQEGRGGTAQQQGAAGGQRGRAAAQQYGRCAHPMC